MATIDEKRAQILAKIPASYSGGLHFLVVNLLALAAVAGLVLLLEQPTWRELAWVPGFFVFANFFEWWIHRGPLHHKRPVVGRLYQRHTRTHHVVFTTERMAIDGWRELKVVLFPAWVLPLLLVMVSPLAVGLYFLSPNLAWLFLASALAYYLVYEWLHTLHHLPAESWIGRRWLVAVLRRHHWRHHDPARMTEGNFNVSFPLADLILRSTLAEKASEEPSGKATTPA